MKPEGWIGVDLDGTLAEYHGWAEGKIGKPIPAMVRRVRKWMDSGQEVRLFTARAAHLTKADRENIDGWCETHVGYVLPITCCKDFEMIELWDDRAVQVVPNTGRRADGKL